MSRCAKGRPMQNHEKPCLTKKAMLPQSRPDGYLARFCQNLAKTVYLARSGRKMVILQDLPENGYLARSAKKMVILQDSCKFVPVELSYYWLPFKQHISI